MMIRENRNGVSRQRACVACLAIEVCSLQRVCTQIPHLKTTHQTCSLNVPSQSKFAFFRLDGVLQTVIVHGLQSRRAMDNMSKTKTACLRTEPHCKPNTGAWISCAICAPRLHNVPRQSARMASVSTPTVGSVQEALKRVSLLRDNEAVRTMTPEVDGRKPREEEAAQQTTIVYNTVYNSIQCDNRLGDANAPKHLDTTINSILSGDPSVAPHCCEPPSGGKDEGTSG